MIVLDIFGNFVRVEDEDMMTLRLNMNFTVLDSTSRRPVLFFNSTLIYVNTDFLSYKKVNMTRDRNVDFVVSYLTGPTKVTVNMPVPLICTSD